MKLSTMANVTVLAVEKSEATKDFGESYKIAIMQGSEAGSLSCTKDAYETAMSIELLKPYTVTIQISEFQGKKTLRVTGISKPVANNAPTPAK